MTIVPALLLPYFAWPQRRALRPFLSAAAVGDSGRLLRRPARNAEQLELPQHPVGPVHRGPGWRCASQPPCRGRWRLCWPSARCLSRPRRASTTSGWTATAAEFTAGIEAVPEGATLLPLLFKHGKTSYFTASLSHAWGYYTVAKNTSAPLVFGVERSYPITYRDFPPRKLIPPAFDQFADEYGSSGEGLQGPQPGPRRRRPAPPPGGSCGPASGRRRRPASATS